MPAAACPGHRRARFRPSGRGGAVDRAAGGDHRIDRLAGTGRGRAARSGRAERHVAFCRSLYQRWRGFAAPRAARPVSKVRSKVRHVRFFDRAPENGRWPGASQRRHRYQDPRCDAGGAARGLCPASQRALAYLDLDLDVSEGASAKRFLIKPVVTAKMLQAAEIKASRQRAGGGVRDRLCGGDRRQAGRAGDGDRERSALAGKAGDILAGLGLAM